MAKRKQSSKNLSSLVNQIQSNLPNFLLGITILVVFVLLSSLYLQGGKKEVKPAQKTNVKEQAKKPPSLIELLTGKRKEKPQKDTQKTHTVKEGETLWTISEKYYGSGYNAYDIAQANKVESPDIIEIGAVLMIPEVVAKSPTKGDVGAVMTDVVTIPGSEYVVKEGDSLWSIAQGAYGDGYAWNRISQSNNLANPDIIEVGQKLSLPR